MLYVFIGRKCTKDEITMYLKKGKELIDQDKLQEYVKGAKDEDYQMMINGMPVIEISFFDEFFVCQHYIGYDYNDDPGPINSIDYTKFPKPFDSRFKLFYIVTQE